MKTIEEIKKVITNCPGCGHKCAIENVSCSRGEHLQKLLLSEDQGVEDYLNQLAEENEKKKERHGKHHGHGGHHEHGEHHNHGEYGKH